MQVFHTSPWVPPEWIKAHGLEPRGVWLAQDFACEPLPLAAGVCAFANAAVRLAEQQNQSAMIFTTHCDQLRRGFDAVATPPTNLDAPESCRRFPLSPSDSPRCRAVAAGGERAGVRGPSSPAVSGPQCAPKGRGFLSRLFLFNLPVTWQTPVAERIFCDELRRLGQFLIGLGGHAPTTGDLVEIMAQYSEGRRRLLAVAPWCPARAYAEAVARFHLDGSVHLPPEAGDRTASGADSVPLAVVGGPLPQAQLPLLDAIEKAGGRVVLNATEAGERSLWSAPPLGQAQLDLARLARGWLANCVDVFQRPNTRLYDWLRERLTARKVRGIVLWHYVGCDLWRAEAQPMRAAFGLPVLLLDADEAMPQRNTGRLEAFLESLR